MTQSNFNIPNEPGSNFRADNNTALQSLVTLSSGASAPTTTYAYMLWADTTNSLLKQRDGANANWIVLGALASSTTCVLYTSNTAQATINSNGDLTLAGTGATRLQTGTTGQRPSVLQGDIRFNTTLGAFEGSVDGSTWTSVATTATVNAAKMQFAGYINKSANFTLTNAHTGYFCVASGSSAFAYTLPANSAVAIAGTLTFFNAISGGGLLTLTVPGSDVIIIQGGATTQSVVLQPGDCLTIANEDGAGNWEIASGSGANQFSAYFAAATSGRGHVNKFRNPAFDIAQRGISGTATTSGTLTLDGWIVQTTGASCAWGQQYAAYTNGNLNALQLTGATSVTDIQMIQRTDSLLAQPLGGKQCTVQFTIYNSTGGSITPTLSMAYFNSRDNVSTTTSILSAQALQTCPNNAWTTVAYTFAMPTGATNGFYTALDLGNNFSTNGKNVAIIYADIRATPGVPTGLNANPPVPETRPVAVELAMCQRFYCNTFGNGNTPAQSFGLSGALAAQDYGATAGEVFTQWNFPVQMRINPTITTYNPSAANANWRDKTGSSDVVVNVDPDSAIGVTGVMITAQTTALTAGHRLYIHAAANAEL